VAYADAWDVDLPVCLALPGPAGDLTFDPAFVDLDLGADPSTCDLHLDAGSPLVDLGVSSWQDDDGSPADPGAYGGPGGSTGWVR
jgi:hypothetical protein